MNSLRPASTFERAERQTDGANQYQQPSQLAIFTQNIHYLPRNLIIIQPLSPLEGKLSCDRPKKWFIYGHKKRSGCKKGNVCTHVYFFTRGGSESGFFNAGRRRIFFALRRTPRRASRACINIGLKKAARGTPRVFFTARDVWHSRFVF